MYKEGRQIVVDISHEVDGVVKDVKNVQKKAKGLLGFLTSVFGKKADLQSTADAAPVKKAKKKKEPPPELTRISFTNRSVMLSSSSSRRTMLLRTM